jgi:hypothetical protein
MPSTWVGLSIVLLAIVPGFVTVAVWSRARTWKGPSGDLRTILQSLAVSAIIQVLVSPLTIAWIVPIRENLTQQTWHVAIWFAASVLILPAVLGWSFARATDWVTQPVTPNNSWFKLRLDWVLGLSTPPSAWDFVFTEQNPDGKFVIIEFGDGKRVGGVFADGSIALTSPERQGLFLSREWVLDLNGNLQAEVPGSNGILIPTIDSVKYVSILVSRDGKSNGESI